LVERPSLSGTSEYYVCSAGFSGQYDILVRRVWGEVSGGKATVEVYTAFGTPAQRFVSYEVDLSEKAALVQVNLDKGQRTEPIGDAQLAGVKTSRLALSKAVLSQVGGYQSDSETGSSSSQSSQAAYAIYRQNLLRENFIKAPRGRTTGYQPIITTLPEGIMWQPPLTGVISADRRYIRLNGGWPQFSGIGEVLTYNIFGGGTGAGGAGTGGFGGAGLGGGAGGGIGGGGF
jgi:hypothetical protein